MITLQAHALNRVANCNGSYFMTPPEAVRDDDSDDRREGIAAHWAAMQVIDGKYADPIELVDHRAPNGVFITAEMVEYIDDFVQDVTARPGTIYTERTVDFYLTPNIEIKTRLDLATYDPTTNTLTIDDFKYGWQLVEVFQNWQLVAGAIGWCVNENISPARIVLNIHQPRPHHADGRKRSWVFDGGWNQFTAEAFAVLAGLLDPMKNETRTGMHCYRCPFMVTCEAYRRSGYKAAESFGRVFDDKLTNDELSSEMIMLQRMLKMGEQLLSAYEELAKHRINSGNIVPNYFMEPSQGKTRWKPGIKAEHIKIISGIDVSKPGMLTPKQAEKIGVSPLIVKGFTERPSLPPKLVHRTADQVASKMFKKPGK